MSRINKQKHVLYESKEGDFDPPGENQQFAQILKSRGNNLHEVEPAVYATVPDGENDEDQTPEKTFLVSMPNKFRKNIWVKRGSFVIIEMIAEGQKVKGEIARILLPEHIKEFKKDGIWPDKFVPKSNSEPARPSDEENSDLDDPIERNTNRWYAQSDDDESSDESDESSSEDTPETSKENVEKQEPQPANPVDIKSIKINK